MLDAGKMIGHLLQRFVKTILQGKIKGMGVTGRSSCSYMDQVKVKAGE